VNFVDRWGLHPEDSVYIITEGPDFFEVYLKYLVGQADMYTIQEVSRAPEQIVLKHTYRHYHHYFIWEFRRELRLREDGSEYWEWVRDEEYPLAVAARVSTQAHRSCQSRPRRAAAARYPPSSPRNATTATCLRHQGCGERGARNQGSTAWVLPQFGQKSLGTCVSKSRPPTTTNRV